MNWLLIFIIEIKLSSIHMLFTVLALTFVVTTSAMPALHQTTVWQFFNVALVILEISMACDLSLLCRIKASAILVYTTRLPTHSGPPLDYNDKETNFQNSISRVRSSCPGEGVNNGRAII